MAAATLTLMPTPNAHCGCDDGYGDIQAVSDDGTAGSQPKAPTVSLRKKRKPKGTKAD